MIRKRDFILYVAIVLFLMVAIGVTWAHDNLGQSQEAIVFVNFKDGAVPAGALNVSEKNEREANLLRLKSKLAQGEGVISSAPPVFTSVDSKASGTEPVLVNTRKEPLLCPSFSSQSEVASAWPQSGVKMREVEGARLVYVESISAVGTIEEKVLLQLPVKQVRAPGNSCIDGPYIGVTLGGELISNNDANKFVERSGDELIGYALDGFPIYAKADNTSALDSCGGVSTNLGYRYYLRADEDVILGCFGGIPSKFNR